MSTYDQWKCREDDSNMPPPGSKRTIAMITEQCSSHPEPNGPDGGTHECLEGEMTCAYCGIRLAPYPCHSCGKFLTAKRMHEAASGEMPHMCEECLP